MKARKQTFWNDARRLRRGSYIFVLTFFACPLVWYWGPICNWLSGPYASGWVQAVGSIAAICVAIYLSRSDAREREARRKHRAIAYAVRIRQYLVEVKIFICKVQSDDRVKNDFGVEWAN